MTRGDFNPDGAVGHARRVLRQALDNYDNPVTAGRLSDGAYSGAILAALLAVENRLNALGEERPAEAAGVWMAHYGDRSAVVPFGSELAARRHATDSGMLVEFVRFGCGVAE